MFKEELLSINETNTLVIEPGMVFHVRITLSDVDPKPTKSVIAIGDTVLVEKEDGKSRGNTVLTSGIQRKYNEISYSLEVSIYRCVNEL